MLPLHTWSTWLPSRFKFSWIVPHSFAYVSTSCCRSWRSMICFSLLLILSLKKVLLSCNFKTSSASKSYLKSDSTKFNCFSRSLTWIWECLICFSRSSLSMFESDSSSSSCLPDCLGRPKISFKSFLARNWSDSCLASYSVSDNCAFNGLRTSFIISFSWSTVGRVTANFVIFGLRIASGSIELLEVKAETELLLVITVGYFFILLGTSS